MQGSIMFSKDADRMEKGLNPDQTSGFTLFA